MTDRRPLPQMASVDAAAALPVAPPALDKKRKMSSWRETLVDEAPPEPAPAAPAAERHIEAKEAHAQVMRALDGLDIDKRAVFVLHEMDGLSIPQIAEVLDVPLNTLYSRLRAAREAFVAAVRRGGAR